MPYDITIREEELKYKVALDYFSNYDFTKIIGNVDFCVAIHQSEKELLEQESLLWAEAKKGISDIYNSLVQLILTIGKARTFDKFLPPNMLGAFDAEKIAFIPYNDIHYIFYVNDFNWNVAPSNYETKEFKMVYDKVKSILDKNTLLYFYDKDNKELTKFIKDNFRVGKWGFTKTRIDKNNFIVIYNKWLQSVKSTIVVNWDFAKKSGVIDGDFYLADLLSDNNVTLKEKLFVVLKATKYQLNKHLDQYGFHTFSEVEFNDGQKAHTQFWNKYERPPLEQYWDYIVERRDLLVPQDIRERKGSFFTPQIWVELSQKYLTDVLGEDWQDEYYIWDCAAGTGNLLNGLTNKYNVWASTLDKQDVDVMKDRIKNGANLLEDHVFQFDFLNDDFSKLPKLLQDIINNPAKRKKLVVYINPPYAEAGNMRQKTGTGKNKSKTAINNNTYSKYRNILGKASNELFVQFLIRIYFEIPDSIIGNFSKLKNLQSSNFKKFRTAYKAKLERLFLVQANLFDNVTGKFPIGFFIWNLGVKELFTQIKADVFDEKGFRLKRKTIYSYDNEKGTINNWIKELSSNIKPHEFIGNIHSNGNDFQHQNDVFIDNDTSKKTFGGLHLIVTPQNLIITSILFVVRKIVPATWLNDRDQFLYPNKKWENDKEFQNDCLAYTLFSNNIQRQYGTNHWIPFTESEVNAREKFESNFMNKFIDGKKILSKQPTQQKIEISKEKGKKDKKLEKLEFSPEAKAVFDAGRELWKYYHTNFAKVLNFGKVTHAEYNVNASLYDIRAYFQGRNESGKMNNKSEDETYTNLIANLRDYLKTLAQKIEPKVYEYEFLKV